MGQQLAGEMEAIAVSEEMLALIGRGVIARFAWPADPIAFEIHFGDRRTPAHLRFHADPAATLSASEDEEERLIQIVSRTACERLLCAPLGWEEGSVRYLPAVLQGIAVAVRDCQLQAATALPYRLAKNIEFFCELMEAQRRGELEEGAPSGGLSSTDRARIAAARQIVDREWSAKLTLEQIARTCGINRGKLARGFRELYGCTVIEALAERRLAEAQRLLIATDLPIALIGYRNGYQNNAAFTRAFGRRFGLSPSTFRTIGLAAGARWLSGTGAGRWSASRSMR